MRPQIQPGNGPEQSVLLRSLAYLPRGLAYALFAPFAWQVERALDLPAVVETLLFDVVMVAAVATLWRARSRWRSIVAPALLIAWLTLIFALAEGNFGTLFRHRGMLMPWVILLGAPVLVEVMDVACRWTQRGTAPGRYSRWPRWQRLLS